MKSLIEKLRKTQFFKKGDKVEIVGNIPFPLKDNPRPLIGTVISVDGYYVYVKPRYQRWTGEWYRNELKHIDKNMKLFAIDSGETDYIAAETLKKAINFYSKLTGINKEEIKEYDIEEIPQEEWSKRTVRNDDFDPTDKDDWKEKTMEELMKEVTEPEIIASTVW